MIITKIITNFAPNYINYDYDNDKKTIDIGHDNAVRIHRHIVFGRQLGGIGNRHQTLAIRRQHGHHCLARRRLLHVLQRYMVEKLRP